MKSLGIVRKMDELGRVTIPIEVRKNLGLETGNKIYILVEGDCIILSSNAKNGCMSRKMDELGRVCIPREIVKRLNLTLKTKKNNGSTLEFFSIPNAVVLKEYGNKCYCCDEHTENLAKILGREVCHKCLKKIKVNVDKALKTLNE